MRLKFAITYYKIVVPLLKFILQPTLLKIIQGEKPIKCSIEYVIDTRSPVLFLPLVECIKYPIMAEVINTLRFGSSWKGRRALMLVVIGAVGTLRFEFP